MSGLRADAVVSSGSSSPATRDFQQRRQPAIPRAPPTTMDDQRPIANMGAPVGLSPSNTASDVPKEQSPGHPSFRRCDLEIESTLAEEITDRLTGNAHRELAK